MYLPSQRSILLFPELLVGTTLSTTTILMSEYSRYLKILNKSQKTKKMKELNNETQKLIRSLKMAILAILRKKTLLNIGRQTKSLRRKLIPGTSIM